MQVFITMTCSQSQAAPSENKNINLQLFFFFAELEGWTQDLTKQELYPSFLAITPHTI